MAREGLAQLPNGPVYVAGGNTDDFARRSDPDRAKVVLALITGAGAGIGEGIARRFAAEGARVVVAELDEETGAAVAQEIGGVFVGTDVSDRAQVENAVGTALFEFGPSTSSSTTRGAADLSAVSRTSPTSS